MRILITGIHGFVGGNLVPYLAPKNEIYGLDIIAPEKDGVLKTYSWIDLDNEVVPEVDAIVHLAGKAHDVKSYGKGQMEEYMKINFGLTQKIFDYFMAQSKCKKFVFFSTAKAVADKIDDILTEDIVPAPVGPYGVSKNAAEQYLLSKMEEVRKKKKDVYIFRPCMIHGPGNKGNLNLLYNVVKKGIPWPLGAFENRKTFTSVENVCFVVNGVLTQDVPSGIYNIGDDETLSTNELIEEICKSLGKKTHIWKIPKGLMNAVAKIGGWLHLPLNPERLRKLTENYISSNEKIKKALGIEKMPVDAWAGLRVTLESFK